MELEIQIKDLPVYGKIGCYNWEKVITQKLLISVNISVNVDDITSNIVDYQSLSEEIKSFIANCRFNLLEEMAINLLNCIMQNNKILHCSLQISKPSALDGAGKVSVVLKSGQL